MPVVKYLFIEIQLKKIEIRLWRNIYPVGI